MTNLELFLTIGGGIIGFISLFVAFCVDCKGYTKFSQFMTIFSIICFGIVFCTGIHYNNETLKEETDNIIITIQDKEKRSSYNGKTFIHRYYIYFDNDKVMQVDENTFRNNNINDTIIINRTIKYRLDRTSNTWEVEKIIYNN